jgi:hypothetical protein
MAGCGVIAAADTWEEIVRFTRKRRNWLAKFLNLRPGIPSHDTIGRVFAALEPIAFQRCLLSWVSALHEVSRGETIAIDGEAGAGSDGTVGREKEAAVPGQRVGNGESRRAGTSGIRSGRAGGGR